jgi:chromosome segregation ATPase
MKKNFLQSLPFNKANFQMLEQERNMLKITLQYISAENDKLKNELEDMKITAKKNKEMLKEYVTQITNKDKVFEKMNAQIEQLTNRLKILENFKKLNSKKINIKFKNGN